jgi:hypothetical protein
MVSQPVWVGVLVGHVRRDRDRCTRRVEIELLDDEATVVDRDQDATAARVGGALPATFGGPGCVPGRTGPAAAQERNGGHDGAVEGARMITSCGGVERGAEWFGSHQPNDVGAAQRGSGARSPAGGTGAIRPGARVL